MLRKRRRISQSDDDDPMSGLNNLSDAMLVLALGFLIFAIMALSVNPDMITNTASTKDVSTAETFTQIIPMPTVLRKAVLVRLERYIKIRILASW